MLPVGLQSCSLVSRMFTLPSLLPSRTPDSQRQNSQRQKQAWGMAHGKWPISCTKGMRKGVELRLQETGANSTDWFPGHELRTCSSSKITPGSVIVCVTEQRSLSPCLTQTRHREKPRDAGKIKSLRVAKMHFQDLPSWNIPMHTTRNNQRANWFPLQCGTERLGRRHFLSSRLPDYTFLFLKFI